MAIQNRAAKQSLDHVARLLGPRKNVLVNGEHAGSHVVGNSAQASTIIAVVGVGPRANFGGRFNDRHENVDVEVGRYVL